MNEDEYVGRMNALSDIAMMPLSDIQHGSFVSPSMRLGMERSIFEPLRMGSVFGGDRPDRLTPMPFSNAPAVSPGQAFVKYAASQMPSYARTSRFPAYLASGFSGGYDPSDIDPSTGQPMWHQPSLFKTMASPTRMLPPASVYPQMSIPFNPSNMPFDTSEERFKQYAVAPSKEMVDMYHRNDELINPRPLDDAAVMQYLENQLKIQLLQHILQQ